ncbi:MAG TPA: TspO/MBR family protein [Terriglobia bacterium]|nr:TspO/MBR family protein [Terriglobia bacterium]
MTRLRQTFGLALSIAACLVAAGFESLLAYSSIGWYARLLKPVWTPPNWLFGLVWLLLFLAMAVAAWLVWRRVGSLRGASALNLFGVQLVLNVCWSAIFFGARSPGTAFAVILLLCLAILTTTIAFLQHSRSTAWLMLPYLLWVAYTAALNFSIWRLNA